MATLAQPRLRLLDELLAEARRPTAVEEFARAHDDGTLPAGARRYRDLIGQVAPGAGQQYAFEVDVDACTGCKGCVTACNRLNGLAPDETWRRVGLLQGGSTGAAVRQTITTACHHCLEPACQAGCPVNAYTKDPITGIVRHLDDQCIGCKYCLFTCPYEVPQYNPERGIVRKCDMCSGRLAAGEAPACVQSCPNQAIRIAVVDVAEIEEDAEAGGFLPGAPDPGVTLPTTRYRSRLALPRNTLPADYHVTRPGAAHPPLVWMLVLTQLAVGLFASSQLAGGAVASSGPLALAVAAVALGASALHLGRPLLAFRAVLGLRTSWLSREIVAFGGFVGLTLAHVALASWLPSSSAPLAWAATAAGIIAVFTSVMVYVATRRDCWRGWLTLPGFYGTTIATGTAALFAVVAATGAVDHRARALATIGVAVGAGKLAWEGWLLAQFRGRRLTVLKRRAELLVGELAPWTQLRFLLGIAGALCTGAALASSAPVTIAALAGSGALATLGGELVERHLFFVAAPAPRMPGGAP